MRAYAAILALLLMVGETRADQTSDAIAVFTKGYGLPVDLQSILDSLARQTDQKDDRVDGIIRSSYISAIRPYLLNPDVQERLIRARERSSVLQKNIPELIWTEYLALLKKEKGEFFSVDLVQSISAMQTVHNPDRRIQIETWILRVSAAVAYGHAYEWLRMNRPTDPVVQQLFERGHPHADESTRQEYKKIQGQLNWEELFSGVGADGQPAPSRLFSLLSGASETDPNTGDSVRRHFELPPEYLRKVEIAEGEARDYYGPLSTESWSRAGVAALFIGSSAFAISRMKAPPFRARVVPFGSTLNHAFRVESGGAAATVRERNHLDRMDSAREGALNAERRICSEALQVLSVPSPMEKMLDIFHDPVVGPQEDQRRQWDGIARAFRSATPHVVHSTDPKVRAELTRLMDELVITAGLRGSPLRRRSGVQDPSPSIESLIVRIAELRRDHASTLRSPGPGWITEVAQALTREELATDPSVRMAAAKGSWVVHRHWSRPTFDISNWSGGQSFGQPIDVDTKTVIQNILGRDFQKLFGEPKITYGLVLNRAFSDGPEISSLSESKLYQFRILSLNWMLRRNSKLSDEAKLEIRRLLSIFEAQQEMVRGILPKTLGSDAEGRVLNRLAELMVKENPAGETARRWLKFIEDPNAFIEFLRSETGLPLTELTARSPVEKLHLVEQALGLRDRVSGAVDRILATYSGETTQPRSSVLAWILPVLSAWDRVAGRYHGPLPAAQPLRAPGTALSRVARGLLLASSTFAVLALMTSDLTASIQRDLDAHFRAGITVEDHTELAREYRRALAKYIEELARPLPPDEADRMAYFTIGLNDVSPTGNLKVTVAERNGTQFSGRVTPSLLDSLIGGYDPEVPGRFRWNYLITLNPNGENSLILVEWDGEKYGSKEAPLPDGTIRLNPAGEITISLTDLRQVLPISSGGE